MIEQVVPQLAAALSMRGLGTSSLFLPASQHKRLFFLGPPLSGTFFHSHSHTFNLLFHGCKRWLLLPPSARELYSEPEDLQPLTALAWLVRYRRTTGRAGDAREPPPLISCVQCGGQALFIPTGWRHAIINLGSSIGAAVELGDTRLIAEAQAVSQ